MSDDQQYPYGQQGQPGRHRQPQPPGRQDDQYDQYDQAYPQPQEPQPHQPQSYQPQQQYQGQDPSQGWGDPQLAVDPHAAAEPAQTWEGQTWDTQHQPHVQYQQPQPQPQVQAQAQSQAAAQPAHAAEPARVSPVNGRPLPPEAPEPAAAPYAPHTRSGPAASAAAAAPGADGYSAPTTMGNARITDAQRARAEGQSPIIPPGMQPAGLTALLGLLLAGGAAVGPYALLAPLVLLQAVTAAGWFRLNGMWPARQGIALAFLGGLVSDVVLLTVGKENAPAAIVGTLGVWVLLTVVLQLRSRAGADERMQGLMATVASAALAILATGHLASVPDAVVVGAVAVAVATVARALPLPGVASVVVALLAAAGAGVAAGGFTDLGTQGALLGLGAGVCALIGLRAASYDYPSRFVHMTAGVALPLTVAAPAIYLLGRALA